MSVMLDTQRKQKVDELFRAFEAVTDGSYLYVCDVKNDYSRWSAEAIQSFDLPGEYMFHAGQLWERLLHPDDRESYAESIAAIFSGADQGHDMQYRVMDRQGRYVVCTCRGTVLTDEEGAPDYFVGTIHNNGLENFVDPLTDLPNQFGLLEHLKVLYSKQTKANIMMIGLGHFSTVNEMWGYDFGNLVIHKVVQILKNAFRNEGILFRADGIRFVLLTRTLSIEELRRRYQLLRDAICHTMEVDGYHPNLLVYGCALEIKAFDVNPQAMFSCLVYAYNQSKEQENGEFQIFKDEIDEKRGNLMELLSTVRKSIENDFEGFQLYYQPIVASVTHRLTGAEALLRWSSPEYGMVPPNRFIPIIEDDPAFVLLGQWILRKAMEDTKPLLGRYPDFALNVNLSYSQLKQDDFVEMVRRNLEITGFPAQNLCLEITERCRLLNLDRLSAIIRELHSMGVRFAIDDFGTGYSSVDILRCLSFEVVKIDKVFVDDIAKDPADAKLLGALSALADICGARVCAEGVETEEQCRIAEGRGIDKIQGYYFSKPIPIAAFRTQYLPDGPSCL